MCTASQPVCTQWHCYSTSRRQTNLWTSFSMCSCTHCYQNLASTDIYPTDIISQCWGEWKLALVVYSSLSGNQNSIYLDPLGTSKLLLGQPRPLCILSKEVGHCSNRHVPLWQMPNDATYCQQLPTDQAGRWAATTALSLWHCHWMAENIRLVNTLSNSDNLNSHTSFGKKQW